MIQDKDEPSLMPAAPIWPRELGDPRRADPDQIKRYGLPQQATASTPLYAAFRQRFLGPGLNGDPIRFIAYDPGFIIAGFRAWDTAPPAALPAARSRNWSGAYLRPMNGRSFLKILGTWIVPDVKRPVGAPSNGAFHSSTWIGLDGQGAYLNSSLPQVGTAQEWLKDASEPKFYAWVQWWARGLGTVPTPLDLPVHPGDQVSAIATVVEESKVWLQIRNDTLGTNFQTLVATAPGGLVVSGATAEWIMERPSPLGTDGAELYDLPAYKDFSFTACVAHSGVDFGAPVEHDLALAQAIRMYRNEHNPPSTPTISTARIIRPQQIDLEYVPPYGQPKPTFP
jgi:hypothetical protein